MSNSTRRCNSKTGLQKNEPLRDLHLRSTPAAERDVSGSEIALSTATCRYYHEDPSSVLFSSIFVRQTQGILTEYNRGWQQICHIFIAHSLARGAKSASLSIFMADAAIVNPHCRGPVMEGSLRGRFIWLSHALFMKQNLPVCDGDRRG
jgi:hypothetical protein